ncbi:Transmembrane protein [Liparis tanakae]|uniref:Transmembrane protein n=1 Tax=Liparis tanakae TaxID=230148 RepID=A0A4Z2HD75_9TELE|nr:Transmembrane protein [Liparis tanakae]
MTRGAWMRRQHDERLKYWFAPRENEKPFTESERAQRWRLSLASLLFITVLLSDHLWFCAEAKLTRTRDKRWDKGFAFTDTDEYPNSLHRQHIPPSPDPSRLARKQDVIFLESSTKPLWRMDTCLPDSLSKDCFSFSNAKTVCLALSGGGEKGTPLAYVNLSDLYLSFCNSYSLLDLFYGFTSPDNLNCTLDMAMGVDLLGCTQCIRAYQLIDQLAEDNYREFELLVQKYETDAFGIKAHSPGLNEYNAPVKSYMKEHGLAAECQVLPLTEGTVSLSDGDVVTRVKQDVRSEPYHLIQSSSEYGNFSTISYGFRQSGTVKEWQHWAEDPFDTGTPWGSRAARLMKHSYCFSISAFVFVPPAWIFVKTEVRMCLLFLTSML